MAERARLTLGILGPVELRGPNGVVPLPARTERAVVVALAAREGRPVTASALATDVWGDEGDASQKLVVAISRLRNRLAGELGDDGRAVVETVPEGYRLAVEHVGLDATRLATLTAQGRQLLDAGEPADARARLEEALALWRGDPLPELSGSATGRAAMARLAQVRDVAVDASSDASLAMGDNEAVITRVEALLVDDPYRERRWAQLMLALYREGRQTDALRCYQRVRTVLADELGIEPGPELHRLEAAILAHDPALDLLAGPPEADAGADEPDGGADRSGSFLDSIREARWVRQQREVPLVGRERKLEKLLGDWRRVSDVGMGGVAFVEGDAGVGKTRLAAELAHRVIETGGRVVAATCTAGGGLEGLLPSVEALGLDLPDLHPGSAEVVTFGFEVARHVVLGEGQPETLLVLDDAHLADDQMVALFARLGDQPLPLPQVNPVMAVVLVQRGFERPAGTAALVRNVERLPVHRHILLERLAPERSLELATGALGLEPELARVIVAEAAGNPRVIVELARGAKAHPPGDRPLHVPQSLREAFTERVDLQPSDVAGLVHTAAVVGPTFSLDELVTATSLDEEVVLRTLERALFARLFDEDPGRSGAYRFTLPIDRGLALEQVSSARRARIVARLGRDPASAG